MRIFVPSWQKPGTWLENLEFISREPWVEGVELLFFDWDAESRRCFFGESDRIARHSARFAFSLHLPDGLPPGTEDLVRATEAYVERYIVHPGSGSAWNEALIACMEIAGEARFSLEYTGSQAFAASGPCLSAHPGLSLCADTGRLLRDGIDPEAWIAARAERIAEIHLHAVVGEKAEEGSKGFGRCLDHRPLTGEEAWLPWLAREARLRGWILDLETFSMEESRASHAALGRHLR